MGTKTTTTASYQVTVELPTGISTTIARGLIKEAILMFPAIQGLTEDKLKIHLTNKEVRYAKR